MKKLGFLTKLYRKNMLKQVEGSDPIKDSYLKKSESNLGSAKILLENNKLEESVALTYYSMYHIVTALFFKVGIKCENHDAAILLLKEIFNIDNNDIKSAKKERVDKQYYTDFKITKEEVNKTINDAEAFNSRIYDFISKLNKEQLTAYKEKFNSITNEIKKHITNKKAKNKEKDKEMKPRGEKTV